jgi:hypothetical protein
MRAINAQSAASRFRRQNLAADQKRKAISRFAKRATEETAVQCCSMRFDAEKGSFAETIERMQPSQVNCYLDVGVYLGEPQTM